MPARQRASQTNGLAASKDRPRVDEPPDNLPRDTKAYQRNGLEAEPSATHAIDSVRIVRTFLNVEFARALPSPSWDFGTLPSAGCGCTRIFPRDCLPDFPLIRTVRSCYVDLFDPRLCKLCRLPKLEKGHSHH